MTYEKSCGAILFTRDDNIIKYVVIENKSGVYVFPKGHVEGDETEKETAMREIYEEVGLIPALIPNFREVDEHPLPDKPGVMKQVVYFLGEYADQDIIFQKEELSGARLLPFDEAYSLLQFEVIREIFKKADMHINNKL